MKKDQSCGQLDLYLDNMTTPVATIDTYSATPTFQDKVYENLALSPGSHTIPVQVKGVKHANSTGFTIALDNFEVLPATQSYTVKRGTAPTGPFTTIASNVTSLSYTDSTGLVNGTTYYYAVSATNANGAGPNSPVAKVQPSSAIQIVDNQDTASVIKTGT